VAGRPGYGRSSLFPLPSSLFPLPSSLFADLATVSRCGCQRHQPRRSRGGNAPPASQLPASRLHRASWRRALSAGMRRDLECAARGIQCAARGIQCAARGNILTREQRSERGALVCNAGEPRVQEQRLGFRVCDSHGVQRRRSRGRATPFTMCCSTLGTASLSGVLLASRSGMASPPIPWPRTTITALRAW